MFRLTALAFCGGALANRAVSNRGSINLDEPQCDHPEEVGSLAEVEGPNDGLKVQTLGEFATAMKGHGHLGLDVIRNALPAERSTMAQNGLIDQLDVLQLGAIQGLTDAEELCRLVEKTNMSPENILMLIRGQALPVSDACMSSKYMKDTLLLVRNEIELYSDAVCHAAESVVEQKPDAKDVARKILIKWSTYKGSLPTTTATTTSGLIESTAGGDVELMDMNMRVKLLSSPCFECSKKQDVSQIRDCKKLFEALDEDTQIEQGLDGKVSPAVVSQLSVKTAAYNVLVAFGYASEESNFEIPNHDEQSRPAVNDENKLIEALRDTKKKYAAKLRDEVHLQKARTLAIKGYLDGALCDFVQGTIEDDKGYSLQVSTRDAKKDILVNIFGKMADHMFRGRAAPSQCLKTLRASGWTESNDALSESCRTGVMTKGDLLDLAKECHLGAKTLADADAPAKSGGTNKCDLGGQSHQVSTAYNTCKGRSHRIIETEWTGESILNLAFGKEGWAPYKTSTTLSLEALLGMKAELKEQEKLELILHVDDLKVDGRDAKPEMIQEFFKEIEPKDRNEYENFCRFFYFAKLISLEKADTCKGNQGQTQSQWLKEEGTDGKRMNSLSKLFGDHCSDPWRGTLKNYQAAGQSKAVPSKCSLTVLKNVIEKTEQDSQDGVDVQLDDRVVAKAMYGLRLFMDNHFCGGPSTEDCTIGSRIRSCGWMAKGKHVLMKRGGLFKSGMKDSPHCGCSTEFGTSSESSEKLTPPMGCTQDGICEHLPDSNLAAQGDYPVFTGATHYGKLADFGGHQKTLEEEVQAGNDENLKFFWCLDRPYTPPTTTTASTTR